jgi:tetratricopeptide (TPR) repeat protein
MTNKAKNYLFRRLFFKPLYALVLLVLVVGIVSLDECTAKSNKVELANKIKVLKSLLEEDPQNDRLMARLAEANFKIGKLEEGIRLFKQAININPQEPLYFHRLAQIYLVKKEYEESKDNLIKAIDLQPQNGQLYYELSLSVIHLGNERQAWRYLKKAEEIFIGIANVDGVYVVRDLMKRLNEQYHLVENLSFEAVYNVRFGYINGESGRGKGQLIESISIPFRLRETGFRWGYSIKASDNKDHSTYFIIQTPEPAGQITGDLGITGLALNENNGVKGSSKQFRGKTFCPFWFDKGDPLGAWAIKVFVDERPVKTIIFNVH